MAVYLCSIADTEESCRLVLNMLMTGWPAEQMPVKADMLGGRTDSRAVGPVAERQRCFGLFNHISMERQYLCD